MKRYLLAGVLLAASASAESASPPFDARIEAKQTDDGIEITAIIANHSHHSACFMAVNQGSYIFRYGNGSTGIGSVNAEPSWQNGMPPPALIQLVPADDMTYQYFWLQIGPERSKPVSVETNVTLIDCKSFFADSGAAQRKVFEATLSAPIAP